MFGRKRGQHRPAARESRTLEQPPGGHPGRRALREVAQLRQRVDELEAAVTESMRLNRRVADVTDLVVEVLLPPEQRDEERIRRLLADYDRRV